MDIARGGGVPYKDCTEQPKWENKLMLRYYYLIDKI